MTLQQNDLVNLVDRIIEVDGYKSKMGSDADIITVSFATSTKESADDLASFLERGYTFVLDADATPGEQSDGTYKVFVEIERDKTSVDNIMELANGVENLTGLKNLRFRYYKDFKSKPLATDSLSEVLPLDPKDYDDIVQESNMNNYVNFFNKSYVNEVHMRDDTLTIKKLYADPVYFKVIDFGPTERTLNAIEESFNPWEFAEIIYLSKYIGDYNITKYGNKLTFENNDHTLVVERI
jgi:hypothetical protein